MRGTKFSLPGLKYACGLIFIIVLFLYENFSANDTIKSRASILFRELAICPYRDWWNYQEKLPADQMVFNKSILYLKPHKTGSETFKEVLIRIAAFYNLTTDKELDKKLLHASTKQSRRVILRKQFDILVRHSRYRKNFTEQRIRGLEAGKSVSHGQNSTNRKLLKIVTIRNPIERLFSHYFSQRRFKSFIPQRGFVRPGRLSTEEEISDFVEWLEQYEPSQQVFYNRDVSAWPDVVEGEHLVDGVREVVDFYDHIIVADQWKQSICLFGFTEKIDPRLLVLRKKNANGPRARRFRVSSVVANRTLFKSVIGKIEYDFLLYHGLLKKYNNMLSKAAGSQLGRYCDRVAAESEAEAAQEGDRVEY